MRLDSQIVVILYNLRSSHNVGSIFRTSDAAGAHQIYLVGTTPCPMDRFGRVDKQMAKVSLGAENFLPWHYSRTLAPVLAQLRKIGFQIIAVEQDERALDYRKFSKPPRAAFVLGNEVRGIPGRVLRRCDAIVEIPLRGRKESLNVAVSAGVILFCTT